MNNVCLFQLLSSKRFPSNICPKIHPSWRAQAMCSPWLQSLSASLFNSETVLQPYRLYARGALHKHSCVFQSPFDVPGTAWCLSVLRSKLSLGRLEVGSHQPEDCSAVGQLPCKQPSLFPGTATLLQATQSLPFLMWTAYSSEAA